MKSFTTKSPNNSLKSIDTQWKEFEQAVVPKTAGKVQREEMKRSFYAGCSSLLRTVLLLSDDQVSEDQSTAYLDGLVLELQQFTAQIK